MARNHVDVHHGQGASCLRQHGHYLSCAKRLILQLGSFKDTRKYKFM